MATTSSPPAASWCRPTTPMWAATSRRSRRSSRAMWRRSTWSPTRRVKEGDPLVTLDDGDYQIARDQAQAQIDTQNLTLKRIDAQIAGAQAARGRRPMRRSWRWWRRRRTPLWRSSAPRRWRKQRRRHAVDARHRPTRRSTRPMPRSRPAMRRSRRRSANIAVLQGQRAEADEPAQVAGRSRSTRPIAI